MNIGLISKKMKFSRVNIPQKSEGNGNTWAEHR